MTDALTPRELDVVLLIALGLPDKEIAYQLGISPLTVRNHLASCRSKTQTGNRTQLAMRAIAAGLAPAPRSEVA